MIEYLKAVDELETDIEIAIATYNETGDMRYIVEADHISHKLEELRRTER